MYMLRTYLNIYGTTYIYICSVDVYMGRKHMGGEEGHMEHSIIS